ncbi:uncharacterized protein LOC118427373 [Branchiostoma floridae]|uniref:Uncharacterized protein LOC118427373 n=1 Tax=Branchiostoma floridae TaxID=7739 RepID=C3ZDS2_BRAFL|nr:uncharacterized protein LOC118427373 [Branchiostoma floridae]|eukprot:XP_002592867.1 hypothetical protein BRAFLDRAFT_117734 [Branchiostoma floridae]
MAPFLLLFVALATGSPVKRQTTGGLDANGDGLISYDEVFNTMSLHEALVALDTDGDGFIYLPQIIGLWGVGDKFYELNVDGDDHLTFREIENQMSLRDFFNEFDFNNNGTLDAAEAYQMNFIYDTINNPTFGNPLDANGDGKLSVLEVQSMNYDEVLVALDADGDMLLTHDELMVLFGGLTAEFIHDQEGRDHDGVLDFQEAEAHHMDVEKVFEILDLDENNYLENGEGAGFYTIWEVHLNSANSATA